MNEATNLGGAMHHMLIRLTVLASITGCAAVHADPPAVTPATAPATAPAPASVATSQVDAVLDALKARGEGLKDFSADVSLTETDNTTMLSNERTGKAWYQAQPDGMARLRVTLDQRKTPSRTVKEKTEYLLENGWLVDRDYRKKNEVRRQVERPGDKINLLKLGEGPFPLPIGQDKDQVYKQFNVTLEPAKQDDPANTSHLKLVPKPDTRFARKFSQIDVYVAADGMPVRISTLDLAGESERKTNLSDVKVNTGLSDATFKLEPINENDWKMHSEAFEE